MHLYTGITRINSLLGWMRAETEAATRSTSSTSCRSRSSWCTRTVQTSRGGSCSSGPLRWQSSRRCHLCRAPSSNTDSTSSRIWHVLVTVSDRCVCMCDKLITHNSNCKVITQDERALSNLIYWVEGLESDGKWPSRRGRRRQWSNVSGKWTFGSPSRPAPAWSYRSSWRRTRRVRRSISRVAVCHTRHNNYAYNYECQ